MTLTLVANIDDEARFLGVVGTVPEDIEPGYGFRIGDELLVLQGFVMPYATTQIDRNRWYVRRAQDGTTATSHTSGDEIKGAADAFVAATSGTTPPSPFAGGSGASDLDAVLALSTGQDIADGLTGANAPAADNVFATMADVGGGSGALRIVRKTIAFDDPDIITGILVATLTDGEVLMPVGVRAGVGEQPVPLGASVVFLPEPWDGTDPFGAFIADNGVDAPYEWGSGVLLNGFADSPAISGEPDHPDLWGASATALLELLNQPWQCRGGDVDVLFRVSSGDDGATDPEATQGEISITLAILAAP